ncbi:MAG: DUF1553 domain-containing protein, partial [Verrucomicrobiota bacterium]
NGRHIPGFVEHFALAQRKCAVWRSKCDRRALCLDAPTREECTAERPVSNTPLVALTLLNDPTSVEAARVFAARILKEGGTGIDEQLVFALRACISRHPEPKMIDTLRTFVEAQLKEFEDNAV